MALCTMCGSNADQGMVGARPETDYETGLQVMRHNVCRTCSNIIAWRNVLYQELTQYFTLHLGRLEASEALHEDDIKA